MTDRPIQLSFADCFRQQTGRVVEPIDKKTAKQMVERIHYSRNFPGNVMYAFGLYKDGDLIGVCSYGIPASPPLCRGIAGEENKKRVLELNRLAIEPQFNGGNEASYLISHSLKMLPHYTFVVSYADTGWTHIGYVYQATNWLYTGMTKPRTDAFCNGVHPRHQKEKKQGNLRQNRNAKHRYVYLVGDRRERKRMLSELRYKTQPYPKGDERHYDTDNPQMAIPIQIVS